MTHSSPLVGVYRAEPQEWREERLAVSKEIHLHTELGLRVYVVYVGYAPSANGILAPMLMSRFNFSWGLSGEVKFFGFSLKDDQNILAFTVVERKEVGSFTDMVSFDDAGVFCVMLALATNQDLVAELHGPDGVNIDFPIAADPKLYPLARGMLNQVMAVRNA